VATGDLVAEKVREVQGEARREKKVNHDSFQ